MRRAPDKPSAPSLSPPPPRILMPLRVDDFRRGTSLEIVPAIRREDDDDDDDVEGDGEGDANEDDDGDNAEDAIFRAAAPCMCMAAVPMSTRTAANW